MLCVDADDDVATMQQEMDDLVAVWSQKPGCPTDWVHFNLFDMPTAEREWLQGFVDAVKQMSSTRGYYMAFYATGQLELTIWREQIYRRQRRLQARFPNDHPRASAPPSWLDTLAIPQGEGNIVGFTD